MNNNKELSSLINYWEDQLSKWEREYRLFGPKGEIAKHQTGFIKTDLNGLRSRINKLYRLQKQLNSTVEELEAYRQKVLEQGNQRMNRYHIHQYE
ncbi:MAG: hypothetical protein QNJ72_28330 [Pleurocapsa sp. MO_226.B13]|nr:hypothetical protein [Pleurocapsa sp. MO_226.B13]